MKCRVGLANEIFSFFSSNWNTEASQHLLHLAPGETQWLLHRSTCLSCRQQTRVTCPSFPTTYTYFHRRRTSSKLQTTFLKKCYYFIRDDLLRVNWLLKISPKSEVRYNRTESKQGFTSQFIFPLLSQMKNMCLKQDEAQFLETLEPILLTG